MVDQIGIEPTTNALRVHFAPLVHAGPGYYLVKKCVSA